MTGATGETYRYRLDGSNRIIHVDENWRRFAILNDAPDLPVRVIGSPIWQFIDGTQVRQVYRHIFSRVRELGRSIRLPFRCDSPELRRYMVLEINPLDEDKLALKGILLREQPRPRVPLLGKGNVDPDSFLHMCSWCKRVEVNPGSWEEVESAIAKLDLFGSRPMPGLSHGVCPDCEAAGKAAVIEENGEYPP